MGPSIKKPLLSIKFKVKLIRSRYTQNVAISNKTKYIALLKINTVIVLHFKFGRIGDKTFRLFKCSLQSLCHLSYKTTQMAFKLLASIFAKLHLCLSYENPRRNAHLPQLLGTAWGSGHRRPRSWSQKVSQTQGRRQTVRCSAGPTWAPQFDPSGRSLPSEGAGEAQCWCWGNQGRRACNWPWPPPPPRSWPAPVRHRGCLHPSCKTLRVKTASLVAWNGLQSFLLQRELSTFLVLYAFFVAFGRIVRNVDVEIEAVLWLLVEPHSDAPEVVQPPPGHGG